MAVRIGELLLKEKRITPEQLQQALTQQKANGGKLGYNLVKMGFVKDEEITALLSKQYGVPSINLTQFKIDPAVVKLVPAETAQQVSNHSAEPRRAATLTIAMTDPTNVFAMDDIKFMTGYNVEPVVASEIADHRGDREVLPERRQGGAAGASPGGTAGVPSRRRARSRWRAAASRNCRRRSAAASDVEVLEELQEISADALAKQGEDGAGRPAGQRRADVGDSEGRERHPHRAVREGAAGPVPHRRDSLQHHERRR